MAERPATQPANRANATIEVPVGIVAEGVNTITTAQRHVDPAEPPPLPINAELKHLGQPTPRLDGRLKVTGAAKYTADIKLPGMLYAQLVTSSEPHAYIKSIDTSKADAYPGVKAVHILDRMPGGANADASTQPANGPRARYFGQPLAAVAATTQAAADEAARLVKINYETIPFVIGLEEAQQSDAPLLFDKPVENAGSAGGGGGPRGLAQKGNVRGPAVGGKRDGMEEAFKSAEVIVEGEYRTQVQTHSPLETHGLVADWKDGGLTVYSSTQGTNGVRDELARALNLAQSKVKVICEYMGGGFGAKFGAGTYGILAANLSKKTGLPVRLMLTRRDQHLSVGNRPSSSQKYRVGAKKDGTLVAVQMVNHGSAGIGTGAGASRPTLNLYPCPNMLTEDYDVFTNAGPSCSFRAPGHPQGAFGYEQVIDELAEKLGMDPIDLREKIDTGERADVHRVERKIGAEKIGWANRKKPGSDSGPIKRGIGMAQALWTRGSSPGASAEVRISKDGSVEVMSSVQDIGTGIRTVLAQIVAEELGITPTDVHVKIGDTTFPAGAASGGSVTTNSMAPPTREAAYHAKRQLFEAVAPGWNVSPDDLAVGDGKVFVKADASKSMSITAAAGKIPGDDISARATRRRGEWQTDGKPSGAQGGVQFAQVAVDTETGVIIVEHIVAAQDCGRPLNPLTLTSQINGAVIQGVSYTLFENRILDRNTAIMVNPNLEEYKITGSRDVPKIDVMIVEQYCGKSSVDASGIGEPSAVAVPAAIANAVYNAIGVRIRDLPMTPAKVLAALGNSAVAEGSART